MDAGILPDDDAGSSPLARGLRGVLVDKPYAPRIIPARAGFTISVDLDGVCAEDHPRSRGVYPSPMTAGPGVRGSSPLARGLLPALPCPALFLRIIPARAGFTLDPNQPICIPADHPRSRGVYHARVTITGARAGSSPLARGLRARVT